MADQLWHKVLAAVQTRKALDFLKGMLAYLLCLCFTFSSLPNQWGIQPRTLANVILVPVILTPAKTVGQFVDGFFLLLLSVALSTGLWALTNQTSNGGAMAVILFFVTYFFSIPRAVNPGRYFASSLIGPIFVFTAIESSQSAYGPNSSDGDNFDYNFLYSTVYTYLIAMAICLVINVAVFPSFAYSKLHTQLTEAIKIISTLSVQLTLSLAESSRQEHDTMNGLRAKNADALHAVLGEISQTLDNADSELYYGRLSLQNYHALFSTLCNLSGVLFSMQSTLAHPAAWDALSWQYTQGDSSDRDSANGSIRSRSKKLDESKNQLQALGESLTLLFDETRARIAETVRTERVWTESRKDVESRLEDLKRSLPNLLANKFGASSPVSSPQVGGELDTEQVRSVWDRVLQLNFLLLSVLELTEGALDFQSVLADMNHPRKLHFNYRHFLPAVLVNAVFAPQKVFAPSNFSDGSENVLPNLVDSTGKILKRRKVAKWRQLVIIVTDFLSCRESIYGFKCAIALLCLHSILISQVNFFSTWYLGAALVTLLIAITPSLGQTFISLPVQILSTSVGALAGFIAITAFGKQASAGIVALGVIFGAPFMYLMLFSMQHMVLGLLTLLAYNYYTTYLYTTASLTGIDSPAVYLYKTIGVTTVSLSFALLLTVIIYPTLSRDVLRQEVSTLLSNLGMYYAEILLAAFTPESSLQSPHNNSNGRDRIPEHKLLRLSRLQTQISAQFSTLSYLLITSGVEPKIDSPFPHETYSRLIARLHCIFHHLQAARYSFGKRVLPPAVRALFADDAVRRWRGEMNEVNRLLFYVFGTAVIAERPLPFDLPNASVARGRFATEVMKGAIEGVRKGAGVGENIADDGWMEMCGLTVSMRHVSFEMDALGVDFKQLYGELPDLFKENPELMWRNNNVMTENKWKQDGELQIECE